MTWSKRTAEGKLEGEMRKNELQRGSTRITRKSFEAQKERE